MNPGRYGAITWADHARARLSVFPREEAVAIVAYPRWRRRAERTVDEQEASAIDSALTGFWLERTRRAPTLADLAVQVPDRAG